MFGLALQEFAAAHPDLLESPWKELQQLEWLAHLADRVDSQPYQSTNDRAYDMNMAVVHSLYTYTCVYTLVHDDEKIPEYTPLNPKP